MLKQYPKVYEDFLTAERSLKHCKISQVGVGMDIGVKEYQKKMNTIFWEFQLNNFNYIVQLIWLLRKFKYEGRAKKAGVAHGIKFDRAFGIFIRQYVGFNIRLFRGSLEHKILKMYIDDFFPNFNERDPFKDELKYPYNYMNLECLCLVMNLPEKLELLEHGDEQKMGYNQFVDYVINYTNCHNDEVDYDHYNFGSLWASDVWCVKVNKDKYERKTKTSSIRKG